MNTISFNSILCITLSLLLLASCSKDGAETHAEEHAEAEQGAVELSAAQMKNADIVLGAVVNKQISGTIKVNGKLDVPPQQLISISAPLGGFLKSTSLLQGSPVKKGQVIATIENLDFIQIQQDYLESRSELERAAADYARQQELARENVNSQKTLQAAKSAYDTWHARNLAYRAKLKVIHIDPADVESGVIKSTINLYSPIDGYVTEVNINIGKFANPTDVLFEIVDTRHLHAELIVFEKDVPKLSIGQKVRFTLANESEERMATIYLIGREIGENRTVQIHCHIDKEDRDLLPGMYLTALVETGGALVPSLPDEAIVDYQGKKYIFIASAEKAKDEHRHEEGASGEHGQHFEMLEIQTAYSELGFTEVSLPDSVRDLPVVIKGAYSLLSKMKNSEEEGGHAH